MRNMDFDAQPKTTNAGRSCQDLAHNADVRMPDALDHADHEMHSCEVCQCWQHGRGDPQRSDGIVRPRGCVDERTYISTRAQNINLPPVLVWGFRGTYRRRRIGCARCLVILKNLCLEVL